MCRNIRNANFIFLAGATPHFLEAKCKAITFTKTTCYIINGVDSKHKRIERSYSVYDFT